MAESSSSVVPGDVEWLPGPGGTRLLRIHPPSPEPPALILRVAGGEETRLEAGPGPHTQYQLPGELDWEKAWLVWPDGTRAAIPAPHGREAQVIELRPRRFRPTHSGATAASSPPAPSVTTTPDGEPAASSHPAAPGGPMAPADSSHPAAPGGPMAPPDSSHPAASGGPMAPPDSSQPAAPGGPMAPADSSHPAAPGAAPTGPADPIAPPAGESVSGPAPTEPTSPDVAARLPPGFVRVPASVTPFEGGPAGPSWTTPPQLAPPTEGEAEWQERGDDVARELAQASAALARAREGERLTREAVLTALASARADLRAVRAARDADASAFAALSGELEAERNAHAVTRGSIGTLADALAAARAELTAAREATDLAREAGREARTTVAHARRDAALARAEAASLRSALEAERAARERAEAGLRELNDRAGLLQRAADLDHHAAGLRDQVELERRAREQAEAAAAAARRPPEEAKRLLADLDAAAAALRAATDKPPAETAPAADAPGADAPAAERPGAEAPGADALAAEAPAADAPAADAPGADTPAPDSPGAEVAASRRRHAGRRGHVPARHRARPRRRRPPAPQGPPRALPRGRRRRRGVAGRADPRAGGGARGSLSYDVTVRGIGTFGVFVEDGSARVVRLSRKRPRGQAAFHLSGDPETLAELLAGERTKLTRFRRQGRVTGRRKQAREELGALPEARLSLAQAVRAGARLEPALVYRALPFAIEPEWTRGHRFTVAQQIVELAPQSWLISVRDGLPLQVVEHATEAPADATVTMSRAAFERLLKDEPHPLGDRPQVKGDRTAVTALKRWTDLARGG